VLGQTFQFSVFGKVLVRLGAITGASLIRLTKSRLGGQAKQFCWPRRRRRAIIPKTEIKNAGMRQAVGAALNKPMNLEHIQSLIAIWLIPACIFLASGLGNFLMVRNAKGPKERRFLMRASIAGWLGIIILALADAFFPRLHLSTGTGVILIFVFGGVRAKQLRIRQAEAANA
jgi:hypothetical protein